MTTYMCRTIARTGAPCPPFLIRAREPLEAVAKASLRLAGTDYRVVEIWTGEKRVVALKNPGIPKSRYLHEAASPNRRNQLTRSSKHFLR